MVKAAKYPVATRKDLQRFCEIEGWIIRKRADGRRKGSHHINYELELPDGRILYTRISHPPDKTTYGAAIWNHILNDQLQVTNDEFWNCVRHQNLPNRTPTIPPETAIPVAVIRALTTDVGIPEAEIRNLTKAQAIARLAEFYTTGK